MILHGLVLVALVQAIAPVAEGRGEPATAARVFVAYAPPVDVGVRSRDRATPDPLIDSLDELLIEPDVASPQPAEDLTLGRAPSISPLTPPRPRVETPEPRLETAEESPAAQPTVERRPAPVVLETRRESGPTLGVRVLERVQPRYPSRCRRRGHVGEVHVRIAISATGQHGGAQVVRSAGCQRLDGAALEAVQRFRFSPAQQDGRAIASSVSIAVRFQERG